MRVAVVPAWCSDLSSDRGKADMHCRRPAAIMSRRSAAAGSLEDQNILICVKQVTLRRQRKRVYPPAVTLALPSGEAVASGSMQHGVPMRDLVADWKKWSRAERVLALMGTLLMVALPLGLLMTG